MKQSNRFGYLILSQLRSGLMVWYCAFFCLAFFVYGAHAQTPITASGLNTQISNPVALPSGQTQYNITGGTRPGGGTNLFHSFGNFNVPNNNIANFLNDSGLATSNILGRVTGGNPSVIFGTIQTNGPGGFGNANLFLMNPYGFLFGPNATLNVGGMVAFTTADYLRLADGGRFNANPSAIPGDLITTAPLAAFGFLGSNPAAIAIQGSTLKVADGQSLSLVGGNQGFTATDPDTGNPISVPGGITMTGGKLSSPGGQINLASVASPGEILAGTLSQAPNINGQSFGALGTIHVLEQSVIDVSGIGGGTVSIRGGQFVLDNSTILANVTGPGPVVNGVESIGSGVDIVVSQDAVIQNGALIDSSVVGNATPGVTYGGVHIKADHVEVSGILDLDTGNFVQTTIQSTVASGSTGGNSGDIRLEANSILLKDNAFLGTQTDSSGNAGNIILKTTGNLEIDRFNNIRTGTSASGDAGNIELTSTQGDVLLTNGPTVTSQSDHFGNGSVGSIAVNAPNGNILLTGSPIFGPTTLFTSIDGTGLNAGKGGIQLTAKNLTIENSGIEIDNFTSFQPGGLTVNLTGTLSMSGGDIFPSTLLTTTRRSARSADLNITAHDILLTDGSQVATETFRSGDAGTLNIFTENLQVTNGAQIRSSSRFNPVPDDPITIPSGAGGTITIQGLASPAQSVLIDGPGSGILTNTEGTGAGGSINILTQSLTVQNGGTLSAATSGMASTATGGTILVKADTVNLNTGGTMTAASTGAGASGEVIVQGLASPAQSIVIDGSGSGIFTNTQGTGAGGDIQLFANSVTLQNGAHVSSSSTGAGIAGDIRINAGNQFAMTNSSVTTEALHSSGGIIKITTDPNGTVQLTDSTISASVLNGIGGGGSVTIDPQYVLLQNSQILANAVFGPGGNIFITTNLLLPDATSVISASSQFGQNGTITIQSPNAPASGKIQPLGKSPLLATTLLSQRCAALARGEFSSFTVAGRDSLPTEPGGWLASPLAALSTGTGHQKIGERSVAMGEWEGRLSGLSGSVRTGIPSHEIDQTDQTNEPPLVSLRQIAPPGFLTQAFAADWSGCTS